MSNTINFKIQNSSIELMDVASFEKIQPNGRAYYLGDYYDVYFKLKNYGVLSLGEELERVFLSFREEQKNLDQILDVQLDENWFSTTLSENNFYINRFSLLIIKHIFLFNYIKKGRDAIFIFDTPSSVRFTKQILKANGLKVQDVLINWLSFHNIKRTLSIFYLYIRSMIDEISYLYSLQSIRKKLDLKPIKKNHERNFIFSWITPTTFNNKSPWTFDSYLGKIPNYLKKKKNDVIFIGKPFGIINNRKNYIEHIIRNEDKCFFIYDFLSTLDILKSYLKMFKVFKLFSKKLVLQDIKLTKILRNQIIYEAFNARNAQAHFFYYILKNLKAQAPNIKNIFVPFENQNWERVLYYSSKIFISNVKVIGIQFFYFSEKYTSLLYSPKTSKNGFTPDVTVASDYFSAKLFRENGHKKVVIGGNYRHEYETNLTPKHVNNIEIIQKKLNPILLCACPIDYNDSLELLIKSIEVCEGRDEIKLMVMFHPAMSSEQKKMLLNTVKSKLNLRNLPDIFDRSGSNIRDAILILYSTSSIPYEAVYNKVLPIHVKSDIGLSGNRFPSSLSLCFCDPITGRNLIKRCLEDATFYKKHLNQMIDFCVENKFIRAEPSVLDSLIKG